MKALLGGLCGVLLGVAFLGLASVSEPVAEALMVLATPMSHLLSWLLDWPLQAEAGMLIVLLATLVNTLLIGLLLGTTVGFVWKSDDGHGRAAPAR